MHIDISTCGDAPRWVYSNENVSDQLPDVNNIKYIERALHWKAWLQKQRIN